MKNILMAAGLMSLSALADAAPVKTCPGVNDFTSVHETFNRTMTALVNQARAQGRYCGSQWYAATGRVSWRSELTYAAHEHSYNSAMHAHYDHTGFDGSTATKRIEKTGYLSGTGSWSTGENIAKGYKSVQDVFNGWITSPKHCANIMNPKFIHTAFDCRVNGNDNSTYWTQVFGYRG